VYQKMGAGHAQHYTCCIGNFKLYMVSDVVAALIYGQLPHGGNVLELQRNDFLHSLGSCIDGMRV